MKSMKAFLGMGALAGAIALGVFAGSVNAAAPRQSQTPGSDTVPATPNRPVRIMGRVDRVGNNRFTLSVRNGMTATVNVSDSTWILVPQNGSCVQGSLNDVQTGRPATVAGTTTNERGVINARVVAQCRAGVTKGIPPKAGQGLKQLAKHVGAGTIKSVSGSTITLTNAKGTDIVVNTTANTVVLNNGFQGVGSLKAGDKVQVLGRPEKADESATSATRTINAWGVHVDNGSSQMMVGRVESVSGNTVTLKTPKHKDGVQVTLGGSTGYKALTIANQQPQFGSATQADVKAGSNLIVEAVASADGKSFTTNAVIILSTSAK